MQNDSWVAEDLFMSIFSIGHQLRSFIWLRWSVSSMARFLV